MPRTPRTRRTPRKPAARPANQRTTAKKTVQNHLRDFFIPHPSNNHTPHILHPKRAVLYGTLATGVKAFVIAVTALMPLEAFLAPDILAEQERKLAALVNEIRVEQGLAPLPSAAVLEQSSQAKATDMANNGYFDHNGPEGRNFKYFLRTAGYDYSLAGENLAMGFSDARAVVNAWIKSPLHYRNIIEPEFSEMGLGIAVGSLNNKETVYIANHFGAPRITSAIGSQPLDPAGGAWADVLGDAGRRPIPVSSPASQTAGETAVPAAAGLSFEYDPERSRVFWSYEDDATTLTVKAYIGGEVVTALATVDEYSILLEPDASAPDLYTGTLSVPRPINDFFEVILEPSIEIVGTDNARLTDTIRWYEIKVADQTPLDRYQHAKSWLPPFTRLLFTAEHAIYLLILVFFIIALAINIVVEIRTQRPHIIIPTALLIILTGMLWLV